MSLAKVLPVIFLALSLMASAAAPAVTTSAASSVTATGAILHGTVNANGFSTTASFDYGPTVSYGTNVAGTPSPVTGTSNISVSATLTGLSPGITYHFRAKGVSSQGTTNGNDVTFTTNPTLSATFNTATDVPVTASTFTASSATVNFTLNFAPTPGTNLMVVKNTGLAFISGAFTNLAQGQQVVLTFGGVNYTFVANYFGGTGNDFVLQWATVRPMAWGYGGYGQFGNGSTANSNVPLAVTTSGTLANQTVTAVAAGGAHCVVLTSSGTMFAWGTNSSGQLGNNGPYQQQRAGERRQCRKNCRGDFGR